jgi:DNA-binding Lrp family transcriptional regulator
MASIIRAYVLIQTEVGHASGVSEAQAVTGNYDVIVQAEAGSLDELGRLVVSRLQLIEGITRTLTCPVVDLG